MLPAVPVFGDIGSEPGDETAAVAFKRLLFVPGLVLLAAELILVAVPLWSLFELRTVDRSVIVRITLPVLVGATLLWFVPLASWLAPVARLRAARRRGDKVSGALTAAAYRATLHVPMRALVLRTTLWVVGAVAIGLLLVRYQGWDVRRAGEMGALAGLHAFIAALLRGVWYTASLGVFRDRLFGDMQPLRRFIDGYRGRLVLVALVVGGGTLASICAFLYYFLPISLEQYLQICTYLPVASALGVLLWIAMARRLRRPMVSYLDHEAGVSLGSGITNATAVYRQAQSLPYRLAATSLTIWIVIIAIGAWIARWRFRFEFDDAFLMVGIALVIAIGGAIYESLWHRETMRPLLAHLTVRYRLPVRGIRQAMSLRTKLLLSFGGVVLFACGLAMFWGFIQYKQLVTDFTAKQAELGLAWLRSEVQAEAAGRLVSPTPSLVRDALRNINKRSPEANAVFYYLSHERSAEVTALGGGSLGAPELPWYAVAEMTLPRDASMQVSSEALAGRHGRLRVSWQNRLYDLGSVAVFYPSYRGRGESVVRPLKELVVFFLVLFGACSGIVLFTVAQFVKPVRALEQRADGMARGELAEPVSSGGEGDEIGRLTFALEEMRRALREKLRSTEEVNVDLERAVQRRTADLAKKNRELAETLDKLTRAQDQLVRSEKLASIGQLVAGIAHEINNPVNAIVNTVGPLEETIEDITSGDAARAQEAGEDVYDMLRVVKRGAQRTKAIVQALHNYSRTDDESLVEFDLNRSIDDSLELLRHVLKQDISVERRYGEVGRVRGHAGQLNQVFMNLLTNAAQAVTGRQAAEISVATERRGDIAIIRIADNGAGIPPHVLPRIFDPFFTTKDVGEGSGLGLSIVHGLVERHGGSIEVDTEPGVGTVFTVSLPLRSIQLPRVLGSLPE